MNNDEKRMLNRVASALEKMAKTLEAINTNIVQIGRGLDFSSDLMLTPREWMKREGINFGIKPEDESRLIARDRFFQMMREVLRDGPPIVEDSNQLILPQIVADPNKRWSESQNLCLTCNRPRGEHKLRDRMRCISNGGPEYNNCCRVTSEIEEVSIEEAEHRVNQSIKDYNEGKFSKYE